MQKIWLQLDKKYVAKPMMAPPLSSIVPSPWLRFLEFQQSAARPLLPFPWPGLGELARPHKAFVVLPNMPIPPRPQ